MRTEATIQTDSGALTVRVGDRVRHWSGINGTVVSINRNYSHDVELYNYSKAVYVDAVIVVEDKRPLQRKESIACRWDGIVAVIA